jgi:hypothetical protein
VFKDAKESRKIVAGMSAKRHEKSIGYVSGMASVKPRPKSETMIPVSLQNLQNLPEYCKD